MVLLLHGEGGERASPRLPAGNVQGTGIIPLSGFWVWFCPLPSL